MKRFLVASIIFAGSLLPSAAKNPAPEPTIEDYRALLDNSPFLSLAFKERIAKQGAAGADQIVFTGYASVGGEWLLCLEPSPGKPHQWLKVGEKIIGFEIESFDPKAQSMSVRKGSISSTVKLKIP